MTHFFKNLSNDEDRWQFIEDYFLGVVDKKYDIQSVDKIDIKAVDESIVDNPVNEPINQYGNSIKIYSLYNDEDDESIKYYISSAEIKKLDDENITRLKPDCLVAEELNSHKQGDLFKINGEYEYLIERIDNYDLTNYK